MAITRVATPTAELAATGGWDRTLHSSNPTTAGFPESIETIAKDVYSGQRSFDYNTLTMGLGMAVPSTSDIRMGCHFKWEDAGNGLESFRYQTVLGYTSSTGFSHVRLRWLSSPHNLGFVHNGSLIGTGEALQDTRLWRCDRWMHLGLHVHCGAAGTSTLDFYIDGLNVLSESGFTDAGGISYVWFPGAWSDSYVGFTSAWLDNCYADDATGESPSPPPPLEFYGADPSGNGTDSAWVNDAGNSTDNYSHVDAVPTSGSEYIEVTSANQRDTWTVDSVTLKDNEDFDAAIVAVYAAQTSSGGTPTMTPISYDGSTYDEPTAGSGLILNDGFPTIVRFPLQPDNSAWNETDFNAGTTEFGIKSTGTYS